MKELAARIRTQNDNRKEWVGADTPLSIANHIREEADELIEAIENFDALQHAEFEVVSELGDIMYLAIKLCTDLGINPEDAINIKITRNSLKYNDDAMSQDNGYSESVRRAKALWQAMGGDGQFFLAYVQLMDDEK